MYRVYIGNLDSEVTEDILYDVLRQQGVKPTALVLKRGYAFIDCPELNTFDRAIDQLNGYSLLGSVLQVEASAVSKRMRTSTLKISNLPSQFTKDRIVEMVSKYGTLQRLDLVEDSSVEEDSCCCCCCTAIVDFDSWSDACRALDHLNNSTYEGNVLHVVPVIDDESSCTSTGLSISESTTSHSQLIRNIPLRILMNSEFIGAIIGRQGQTISRLTAQTKARIDIHGKESTGLLEKMISISGSLDECSAACYEIMNIAQQEATNANKGDVTLRMLVDDRYCGRIIGRDGKTIKKIRDETGTRISISNVQEMTSIYPDRVVAIRGDIDSMSQAENAISAKLRECYERDMVNIYKSNDGRDYGVSVVSSTSYQSSLGISQLMKLPTSVRETCQICIPNYAVGAIIGTAGVNIKRIIRDSNAFVTVEPRRDDQSPCDERIVTVKGNSDACWRASYFIFEKMKMEGFASADGDVRLRTIISIPQAAAGRVVGRGGKNVREIQRSTGAIITLSSANTTPHSELTDNADVNMTSSPSEEVHVEVYGNFIATQGAYSRIRSIVYKTPSTATLSTGAAI